MVVEQAQSVIEKLHNGIIYPAVRVRSGDGGGSGTLIYSKPNAKGNVETFVLTNHHVIASAIAIKEQWDPWLKRNVKKEERDTVTVERFNYEYLSNIVGIEAMEADIVAWDDDEDTALLQLRRTDQFAHVARLYPKDQDHLIYLGTPLYACGCGLLEPPVITAGMLNGKSREIENRRFFMSAAPTTFGNSGSGVYIADTHEFIGIPSRVPVLFMAGQIQHMNYFIPPYRWYGFIDKAMYRFIYDPKHTSECCAAEREEKRWRAEMIMDSLRHGLVEPEPGDELEIPATPSDPDPDN